MALENASRGAVLLAAVSVLGLAASLAYYFVPENGINGTLGVAIVIGSTALMFIASAAIAAGLARGWIKWALAWLILLDIIATGLAAYMLEANVLIGFMALAFIAWLYDAFSGGRRRSLADARAVS